jgi:diguanylate cyclase (GGDEF)-like protein
MKSNDGEGMAELERLRGEVRDLKARITELDAELERTTRIDSFSGVLNRGAVIKALEGERQRSERYGRPLAVILLDLDRFTMVNDMHGPAAGDGAIKRLVDICRSSLRVTDAIGRYDGEEFLAVLPEVGGEGAAFAAERIRAEMQAERFKAGDASFTVTVSVGVATMEKGHDLDPILANADAALYDAKHKGRNRVVIYGHH